MITDAPPKKANREGFLESDRIETLETPQDGTLAHGRLRMDWPRTNRGG
jgi:hypothetical protein